MSLLANFGEERSHLTELRISFEKYDKAYIAVAFFSMSGFYAIKNLLETFLEGGGELHIVVGLDNFVTEPDALQALFDLMKGEPNSGLYIKKTDTKGRIFHPKLYLFKSKKRGKFIIGSANLTAGGLEENEEISIAGAVKLPSPLWSHAFKVFEKWRKEALPASDVSIGTYKKEFLSHQKKQNFSNFDLDLDYAAFEKYLEQLGEIKLERMLDERKKKHEKSLEVLDEMADTRKLTKKRFITLLDKLVSGRGRSWRSNGLQRGKKDIYKSQEEFLQLVRFIRDNAEKSPKFVFPKAKELIAPIEGASINYVTEIMASYNPNNFAILNASPYKVLTTEAGIRFGHKTLKFFDGDDYAYFCTLMKEIYTKLGFSDMLEVDSFFNDIYRKIKDAD